MTKMYVIQLETKNEKEIQGVYDSSEKAIRAMYQLSFNKGWIDECEQMIGRSYSYEMNLESDGDFMFQISRDVKILINSYELNK